jgi:hypothetical protein
MKPAFWISAAQFCKSICGKLIFNPPYAPKRLVQAAFTHCFDQSSKMMRGKADRQGVAPARSSKASGSGSLDQEHHPILPGDRQALRIGEHTGESEPDALAVQDAGAKGGNDLPDIKVQDEVRGGRPVPGCCNPGSPPCP